MIINNHRQQTAAILKDRKMATSLERFDWSARYWAIGPPSRNGTKFVTAMLIDYSNSVKMSNFRNTIWRYFSDL